MTQLKRIALLTTGGTIAATHPDGTATTNYEVDPDPAQLIQAVPEIQRLAQIEHHPLFQIDSSAIQPEQQKQIVLQTNLLLTRGNIDAVVITHGTDTLEETALLLHLCLKTAKPVVLVGAMRPASALSADGPLNLYQAVQVATHADAHNLGVLVVMDDQIHSARFVRKMHSLGTDAFASPDTGPLGLIGDQHLYIGHTPRRPHTTHSRFSLREQDELPVVDVLYDHPQITLGAFQNCIEQHCAGVILAGTGNGNLSPVAQQGATLLHEAGIPVIRTSQTGSGPVSPSTLDQQCHTLPAHWWGINGARILLSLCLLAQLNREQIQHTFRHY